MRSLILAVAAAAAAAQNITICDPDYDCKWTHVDSGGTLYEYNFLKLCSQHGYEVSDTNGHNFFFNICGNTPRHCLPSTYLSRYAYGAAIQFYGAVPSCNLTAPECYNPLLKQPACCTQNCHVLGVGTPVWSLVDPLNPATGGVKLNHKSVPSTVGDPDQCPYNPKTLAPYERQITMQLNCDAALPANVIEIGRVNETTVCHYTVEIRAGAACACEPYCVGKTCGPDGCGGFCSGATLAGACPFGETCVNGDCCKPDCRNGEADCGSDGCGGTCGRCGMDERCNLFGVCVSDQPYIPVGPAEYRTDSGGLAGSFFGGAFTAVGMAGLFFFYKAGGKQRFDAWRMGKGAGAAGSSAESSSFGSGAGGKDASVSLAAKASASSYGSYGSGGSSGSSTSL